MNRLLTAFTTAAVLLAAAPLTAAPRPDAKNSGPAVVGQAKSLNELLEMTKAIVKNVGGEALYKSFEKEALPNLDPKKLPGIDPKRMFGLYGTVDADLSKCRGVLLIPITSEKDFLDMLDTFRIKWNKGKDAGTFDIVVPPDVPFPVAGRIHKEYAYIALGGFDVLEDKVILDPTDVINPKEKAVAYLGVKLDRIPADTKKQVLSMLREQTDQLKEMIQEPELKDAFFAIQRLGLRWLKSLFDEGKELALRFEADTKTGELTLELSVDGLPKSALAESIAKRPPTRNAFASLAGDDYAARLFASAAPLLVDEVKEAAIKLIDLGQKEALLDVQRAKADAEVVALIEATFKSLKTTLESGEMDLASALRGPNKEGFYTAVGAVHCKEGANLEKAIKGAVKLLPERERAYFKFDAGKIGDLVVHEIDLSAEAVEPAKKIFGSNQKAYFTFGKDNLYASYGADGMKLLKEAIEAKPAPAAVFDQTINPKKAADVVKRMMPDNQANNPEIGGFLDAMNNWGVVASGMRLSIEGGERLKVRASFSMAIPFMFMSRGFGAGAAKPVPAPIAK